MLANAINLLTQGMTFMGGALIVFGLINLGMTIKDGMQGGGQLSGAIAMMIGGAIIIGASVYFGSLDISWAG